MLFTLPGAFATSGGTVIIGGGSMGLAPNDATYVTLSTNATLLNERVLTAGTGIALTDGGAGSTITVDVDATLTEILTSGNTTGGVDVEFTAGDALLLVENAAVPWTPAATKGCLWVKNTTPNEIYFTDDAGTDFNLATGGETLAQTLAIGNTTGGTDVEVSAGDALLLVENAAVPWTPAATKGCLWIKNDAPNTFWFTDDAGTDHPIFSPGTKIDADATSENLWCVRANNSPTVGAASGQVNFGSEVTGSHGTSADYAAILSGYDNLVSGTESCVAGGMNNDITGIRSFIGGGNTNVISQNGSAICGGLRNTISNHSSFIGGGQDCTVSSQDSVCCGGNANTVSTLYSACGGGQDNNVGGSGSWNTVAGGDTCVTSGSASHASILGGQDNTVSAIFATVLGGRDNLASGTSSFALGRRAHATHQGSLVWGDYTDADVSSSAAEEATFRASGGFRIFNINADTAYLLELESQGANGADTQIFAGARTPVGNVTGNPGDLYVRADDGTSSTLYVHQGAGSDNTSWTDVNATPAAETLAATLAAGSTSGGTDLEMSAGDALLLNENASVPWTPAAAKGCIWVKNATPNELYFTDDAGTDFQLGAGGGGGTAIDANGTSENLYCARTNQSPTIDAGSYGQVNLGSETTASHGTTGHYAAILSGHDNIANFTFACVCGGENNDALASHSFIGGGTTNVVNATALESSIVGGDRNVVSAGSQNCFLGGGLLNSIEHDFSVLGGGQSNTVSASRSFIGCGQDNDISSGSASQCFLGGGQNNVISSAAQHNVIVGGQYNLISSSAGSNFIGGGGNTGASGNTISGNATYASIVGGEENIVAASWGIVTGGRDNDISGTSASYSFIGGGRTNVISATDTHNCILGGDTCSIAGASHSAAILGGDTNIITAANYGVAAGRRAKVNHAGTFVFADGTDADVASVAANEFHVGAQEGIRLSHTTEEHGDVRLVRELQTSDGANNNIYSETLADNSAMLITARIVGMESDGSDRATYILNALVYRDGAGATIQGATDRQLEIESDANWTADIDVSSNDVIVYVNGNSDTVEWRCTIQKQQVT